MAAVAPPFLQVASPWLRSEAPAQRSPRLAFGSSRRRRCIGGSVSIGLCVSLRRRARREPDIDTGEKLPIDTGIMQLELLDWLNQANLHPDLSKDALAKFGGVPQQADEVVEKVVQRIQEGARRCVAPSSTVHPFGSTVNGFGEESSDLDVLVAIKEQELTYFMSYANWGQRHQRRGTLQDDLDEFDPPKNLTPKAAMCHAVQQLADYLPELGFKVLNLIPQARKPLVTLEDMQGPLKEVDISINNSLPLYNSRLLKSYSQLDERVRPLVLLVKVWAKGKRICGAHEGNLSSYSWTIMVLYFLQLVGLLPSLQLLHEVLNDEKRILSTRDYWGNIRDFDTGFLTVEEYQKAVADKTIAAPQTEDSLTVAKLRESFATKAQLLYGFIRFFATEYDWGTEVVSMHKPDRKDRGIWFKFFGKNHPEPVIHVEDPIEFRDLNIVMRRERLAQMKEEFNHALEMLNTGCSLEEFLNREPRPEVFLVPTRRRRRHRAMPLPT
ncbi:unnamed protein product [Effrenium voratum]|uniref:Poly(A) RNA polymerase mitochondrial-like central palm domain-containing protein n=1 Tax=Effrenium voratum TaxID=2562239 RepID=A0AA36N4N0_9DINO|nr:unnamed protein product [Effrenium voratum]